MNKFDKIVKEFSEVSLGNESRIKKIINFPMFLTQLFLL